MDFFEQQESARRHTHRLLILFAVAVVLIVVAVNGVLYLGWITFSFVVAHDPARIHLPARFFETNTAISLLFILGGTLAETWNLRDGGEAVARMLGARRVMMNEASPAERQLINIVEEMSLASGVSRPQVYILDKEEMINAFVAGFGANEAVIVLTAGALARLSRDELQGVVAHEFSHILNGDMRLNMRMMGVVFGILLISMFGIQLMEFSRAGAIGGRIIRSNRPGGLLVLAAIVVGALLWLVGYIGVFFARVIKGAVSREREFLADASALQFTRNADGIGGALRKISGLGDGQTIGSEIQNPNAERLSHLFLGAARASFAEGWQATHPPIRERIRRIYGHDAGALAAPMIVHAVEVSPAKAPLPYVPTSFADAALVAAAAGDVSVTPRVVASDASNVTDEAERSALRAPRPFAESAPASVEPTPISPPRLSFALREALHDPTRAQAIVIAMVLAPEVTEKAAQMTAVANVLPTAVIDFVPVMAGEIAVLDAGLRMPLLDLAMPTLKALPGETRAALVSALNRAIVADGRVTLSEFVLQTIVTRRLAEGAGRAVPIRFGTLDAVWLDLEVVLSLAAHVAAGTDATSAAASAHAAFKRGASIAALLNPGDRRAPQDGHGALTEHEHIGYREVNAALDRLNQLAPLQKPSVIKALVAVIEGTSERPTSVAALDILRAISAAIDVPMPAQFAQTLQDA